LRIAEQEWIVPTLEAASAPSLPQAPPGMTISSRGYYALRRGMKFIRTFLAIAGPGII
jgi:hypothetical protein